jgi:large subunit ribosomal protein L37Ae
MVAEGKSYGSVKRFGVRYGAKLKQKIGKLEATRRAETKCPYCHYESVKRLALGIWFCGKCKSKFTGRAYYVGKEQPLMRETGQEMAEVNAEVSSESTKDKKNEIEAGEEEEQLTSEEVKF